MLALVEFGLSQILGFLALAGIAAMVVGHFLFGLGTSKKVGRNEAIKVLQDVVGAQGEQIDLLKEGLKGCQAEHAECQRKVNEITAFNLRLQARGRAYEKTINRLELKLRLPMTDFITLTHAPEDSDS